MTQREGFNGDVLGLARCSCLLQHLVRMAFLGILQQLPDEGVFFPGYWRLAMAISLVVGVRSVLRNAKTIVMRKTAFREAAEHMIHSKIQGQ